MHPIWYSFALFSSFLWIFWWLEFALGSQAAVIKVLLEVRNCFFFFCSRPALWLRSPYLVGSRSTFNRVKQQLRKDYHSPPSSDRVKNVWRFSSISKYAFIRSTRNLYHLPNPSFMKLNAMKFRYVRTYIRMYVCVYVCICVYVYTHTHTYIHTYIHTAWFRRNQGSPN
jgi:hypothetical protein